MPSSLRHPSPSTELNSVAPRMAKASIGVNSPADVPLDADAVSLFFVAVAECGMSEKEAAYVMGMDPAQLSRVKSRQARLTFDALWRLPVKFWAAFHRLIANAKGLTEVDERRERAHRIGELMRLLAEEIAS